MSRLKYGMKRFQFYQITGKTPETFLQLHVVGLVGLHNDDDDDDELEFNDASTLLGH